MRRKFGFRILIVVGVLVAIVAGSVLLNVLTDRTKSGKDKGIISLKAPSFISSAEAAASTLAFPVNEASISAYVKVAKVDIEKMKKIYTKVEKVGDNFIYGITSIPNLGGDIDIHVYVDTDGWLVAYVKSDEPAANIMNWGDVALKDPQVKTIQSMTLDIALIKAGDAIAVTIPSKDIKYYDFESPEANGLALFVRIVNTVGTTNVVQMELPANYTLYEASYYHYITYRGYNGAAQSSELKVDGTRVNYLTCPVINGEAFVNRILDSYKGAITIGTLHKIEISLFGDNYAYSTGVATVLIYKAQ
jgi:hypothetical protein